MKHYVFYVLYALCVLLLGYEAKFVSNPVCREQSQHHWRSSNVIFARLSSAETNAYQVRKLGRCLSHHADVQVVHV